MYMFLLSQFWVASAPKGPTQENYSCNQIYIYHIQKLQLYSDLYILLYIHINIELSSMMTYDGYLGSLFSKDFNCRSKGPF